MDQERRSQVQVPAPASPDVAQVEGVDYDSFYAHMVEAKFIYTPTAELWPAVSVNKRLPWKTAVIGKETVEIAPASWLTRHRPVEQWSWAPGLPQIINNRLVREGGWIPTPGVRVFNRYTPPTLQHGDADKAGPWVELVNRLWPNDADHIFSYLAHRVQRPQEKINHALVLGGEPGHRQGHAARAGEVRRRPVELQRGVTPTMLGRFNGFAKSVILRVSEARDLGDVNRYSFYDAHEDLRRCTARCSARRREEPAASTTSPTSARVVITTNYKSTAFTCQPTIDGTSWRGAH